jgi:hypothetical protein
VWSFSFSFHNAIADSRIKHRKNLLS